VDWEKEGIGEGKKDDVVVKKAVWVTVICK